MRESPSLSPAEVALMSVMLKLASRAVCFST